jgi:hypothetical protein
MAQKTAWDGATLTESDINTYLMGEGGAWTTWTPAVYQSALVASSVTFARYARYGRTIHVVVDVQVTAAGTSSNAILITLPVTAATSGVFCIGGGSFLDASTGSEYRGNAFLSSTTRAGLSGADSLTAGLLGAAGFTGALASGDLIRMSFTYEAAS